MTFRRAVASPHPDTGSSRAPRRLVIFACVTLLASLTPTAAWAQTPPGKKQSGTASEESANQDSRAAAARSASENSDSHEAPQQRTSAAKQASAELAPSSPTLPNGRQLSGYEGESIDIAMKQVPGEIELDPEGKIVESISVVPLEVFEARDKVPLFLNWFHVTTRKGIIRREVLLREGHPYRQLLADETERNLRVFSQLSVVLLVPLKGSAPDRVRVLIVTKDVWSLRVSWEPTFYNGKLTGLSLSPSESNLGGTTQRISGNVNLTSRHYWLGGSYYIPRIDGSRVNGYLSANAIFNCRTSELEGGTGLLDYGQPLYSSLAEWSWRTAASWSSIIRHPVEDLGGAICSEKGPPPFSTWFDRAPLNEPNETDTIERETVHEVNIPYAYREDRLRGQFVVTRSFNRIDKLNFSVGAEVDQRLLSAEADTPSRAWGERRVLTYDGRGENRTLRSAITAQPFTPSANAVKQVSARFRERILALHVPRLEEGESVPAEELITGDRRVSPYLQLHAFHNRFLRTINYNTLGLQEDVQLGHDLYLRLYPAFRPLSSRTLLGVFASAAYTWQLGGGFVRAVGGTTVEMAADGNENTSLEIRGTEQSDALLQADLHAVSPDIGLGRFVSSASLLHAPIRYLQRFAFGLGGTDRLRGYAPSAFLGGGRVVLNNEFRSKPLRLYSAFVGANLFYDVGDAATNLNDLELRHGGGVGLRFLFPQLDRNVFRIDLGFPLQADPSGEITLLAGFGQTFEEPTAPPAALLIQ